VENLGVLPWPGFQAVPTERIKETQGHCQRGAETTVMDTAPDDPGAGSRIHPIPKGRSSQSEEKL